ncbi:hypothetical protein CFOL_v3_26853 [Cephalotus follicularis]|uniref:Hemerythrin domain-containing protein n=1 Tax=Cephalotus follicularis TaxID=3775 RepID=A0A1Q3CT31_CEPFO|nr:hypothetical protein CFOL_v3_26853 [Cephalotus follicularis]
MGNCLRGSKNRRSTAGIAPYDNIRNSIVVDLRSGPEGCLLTTYIRFALEYKYASYRILPGYERPAVSIGTETVSGGREAMLRLIESRFPEPRFKDSNESLEETTPLVVRVAWLQHSSIVVHLGCFVRWTEDLSTRGGLWSVDPAVGSPRMEVRKFEEFYSVLLEVMLEHAQMEERVIFPLLTKADPDNSYIYIYNL